jgi:TetR/AcrR family transcriptional regulator, transcriptional repressor for nem operon
MARDGEATRKRIIEQTAGLLNKQGYLSTPVSEIMRVTGLQKGGIYNHFESRDGLALEAFDYAVGQLRSRLFDALEGKQSATDKLLALFGVFRNFPQDKVFQGGCPIMNLAIESDDADPRLREAARKAMANLIELFERVIAQGIEQGEFMRGDMQVRARAGVLVATIEGGIMLSNLYKDPAPLQAVLTHLEEQVRRGLR